MIHKAIKGFEDYLVTDTGRVYSIRSQKYLKAKKLNGYLHVVLCENNVKTGKLIHRLVAEAFIENPENKETVDHINRIRDDNRVENLRWFTSKEQQSNSMQKQSVKKSNGEPIIETINNEVSRGYLSMSEVRNIDRTSLSWHVRKGERDFICKGRHFIVPKQN